MTPRVHIYIYIGYESYLLKELCTLFVMVKTFFWPPKTSTLLENIYVWHEGFLHFTFFCSLFSLGWFTPATNVEFRLNFVHFREWKTKMDPKKNSLHNRKHTNKNWTRNTECLFQSQPAFLTLQKLALKCFPVCIWKCRPRICFNFCITLYFRLWSGVKLA